jgi:DNA (cytosine-5)-methyltransferase 3A
VGKYYQYDKNYPDTIQLGDVTKVKASDLEPIDLLVGGSPCQGFSFAGKQLNFDDPRSALFFEFVRLLKECREINPEVKFLLENVKMKKEYQVVISEYLGVEPIEINSALVSAQNRKRLYWTNIEGVQQPKDEGIFLKDVLEFEVDEKYYLSDKMLNFYARRDLENIGKRGRIHISSGEDKSKCLTEGKGRDSSQTIICVAMRGRNPDNPSDKTPGNPTVQRLEPKRDGKTNSLTTVGKDNLLMGDGVLRRLAPIECERLQTLPDNYTEGVSDTQRYKMLGNGWTLDVTAHILSYLPDCLY